MMCKFHHRTGKKTRMEGLEYKGDLKSQPSENISKGLEKAKSQMKKNNYKQRNNILKKFLKPQDSLNKFLLNTLCLITNAPGPYGRSFTAYVTCSPGAVTTIIKI